MGKVNPTLVSATASVLRNIKLSIMVPILAVFLCSYPIVYDIVLRPFNGYFLLGRDNYLLSNGVELLTNSDMLGPLGAAANFSQCELTKYTFTCDNAFDRKSFVGLLEFLDSIPQSELVLSPALIFPGVVAHANLSSEHKVMEKHVLKSVNHDFSHDTVHLFYDDFGRVDYMITSAKKLHVYVLSNQTLNEVTTFGRPGLLLLNTSRISDPVAVSEFVEYIKFLSDKKFSLNLVVSTVYALQLVVLVAYLLHVYLSLCNSHKLRSNIGLLIGWLTGVLTSAAAAAKIMVTRNSALSWSDILGPSNWICPNFYLMAVVFMSSRLLFRIIVDLAGDSDLNQSENIHKRLIKFYLGINRKMNNSLRVYFLSETLEKHPRIQAFKRHLPLPNTTIMCVLNLIAYSLLNLLSIVLISYVLSGLRWLFFYNTVVDYWKLAVLALVLDHTLQLTYLVAIIIIDLNRVDLMDVLNSFGEDEKMNINLHEANPISAFLYKHAKGKSDSLTALATYCVKVSPLSPLRFWLLFMPLFYLCSGAVMFVFFERVYPMDFPIGWSREMFIDRSKCVTDNTDLIYKLELLAVIIFILAISELTFSVTYAKNKESSDFAAPLLNPETELFVAELFKNEGMKNLECLTLSGHANSDILKLYSNPCSSSIVSVDIDHTVSLWSPLTSTEDCINISTFLEPTSLDQKAKEFWPINHVEISSDGDYVMLINYMNCRIKCFDKKSLTYIWELSLTNKLNAEEAKMVSVLSFFRKKTIPGFLARKFKSKQRNLRLRSGSVASTISMSQVAENSPPSNLGASEHQDASNNEAKVREYEKSLHREEFIMILESGEMITVACDSVQIKAYNLITQLYQGQSTGDLKIVSLKLLTTSRVNDRVVCNLSNDDIVVGTAINNLWRFTKLEIDKCFTAESIAMFAPPLMSRSDTRHKNSKPLWRALQQLHRNGQDSDDTVFLDAKRFAPINESLVVTIDFVGMIVRVKNLEAELIDMQTGTILKVFHIGSFKPGSFRVAHSEPTHCKFCGCASIETFSLVYEDFYDKTLILHTFNLENKRSKNNICLRAERDPREIRCLGFEATVETHYWFEDIEQWELTDMNIIIGIKRKPPCEIEIAASAQPAMHGYSSSKSQFSTLKHRTQKQSSPDQDEDKPFIGGLWQGFVVTAHNGKMLEYEIPKVSEHDTSFGCLKPHCIVKFGFKAVAIAFGYSVKILYLGSNKLIESELYYSGSTSSLAYEVLPGEGTKPKTNQLLFINKRRKMTERRVREKS